ncbi:DNA repair exonuclease [Halobacillus shinanisalinarum]|uniref:DNA repair exonuclease n=1 Tax=Halobacillus shinanisalinarum TaxID=2932258 RepID=A0ABY4H1A3_9BACI|nr:DNA repair exonuclease [Halobacillus shinanisalinarum]UOQ92752.1 DNA repair exonuclease [Halobacillus shinanisalinarum]
MSTLRFIHSADLHLDSPFKGRGRLPEILREQMRAGTFEAFDRLIEQAIYHRVDFVLIVGDLFNEETRSLKAQVQLREGFKRLEKHDITVFISYGNHDYIQGMRYPITYPNNVHSFDQETVKAIPFYRDDNHLANIYGFSYVNREVKDRKVKEFVKEGTPVYHIGMLHGSLETNGDHDVYAPFKLEELRQQPMDYWALGHIHKWQHLSEHPPIVYPGNIQARSRKEQGEKGCSLVQLGEENKIQQTFIPLHSFTFEEVSLPAETLERPEELEAIFEQAKEEVQVDYPVMLSVTLYGRNGVLQKWQTEGVIQEWVDLINEAEDLEKSWVWIDDVTVYDRPAFDIDELRMGHDFTGEYIRNAEQLTLEEWREHLSPLYQNRRAAKYLDSLAESDHKEIIERAKQLVVEQLLSEGMMNE